MVTALDTLKGMIARAADADGGDRDKWQFEASLAPLRMMGNRTLDDLFVAFLRWSQGKHEDDYDASTAFNVEKAFRRLERFATWGHKHHRDMQSAGAGAGGEAPYGPDAFLADHTQLWSMLVSVNTSRGAQPGSVIWVIEPARMNVEELKQTPPARILRYMWHLTHALSLDADANRHGCVIVENLAGASLWVMLGLVPSSVKAKADKLLAGASAVKVKRVLLLNAPWGLRLLIRFVRLFLSKKIRSRFRVTTEAKMAETVGGWSQIPSNRLAGCGSCADRVVELVQSSTRTPASTGGGHVHVGDGNDGGGGGGGGESTRL